MTGSSLFILILPFGIFLWAAWELVRAFIEAEGLRSGVNSLNGGTSAQQPFPGNSALLRRTASVAQKARQARVISQIHPEREIASITAEFSARLGRTRALAGLLIILGLLITLGNLGLAVERMKATLGNSRTNEPQASSATQSDESDGTASVRNGMAGIASAAGTAFGYSGTTIFLAGTVLFLSILAQRQASSAIREFAVWLFDRHDELLTKQIDQPQDTPEKLAYAADTLTQVAKTFQETSSVLADFGQFGEKLDSAAQEIKNAVINLPARLDSSLAKISDDVAVGIKDGLTHQSQYLNALVTIYSDHAIMVQRTIEFISQITQANKSASEALVNLRSLPDAIQSVARSSEQTRMVSQELATTVFSLEKKVEALPAGDLAEAASKLTDAAGRLIRLESSITAVMDSVKSHFQSAIDDATRRSSETMIKQLEGLSSIIQVLKADVNATTAKQAAELKTTLVQLKEAIDQLRTSTDPGMESLTKQIDDLIHSVGSLPSMQIMRIFGSNKAHTERP
jgi:hypothetical protein